MCSSGRKYRWYCWWSEINYHFLYVIWRHLWAFSTFHELRTRIIKSSFYFHFHLISKKIVLWSIWMCTVEIVATLIHIIQSRFVCALSTVGISLSPSSLAALRTVFVCNASGINVCTWKNSRMRVNILWNLFPCIHTHTLLPYCSIFSTQFLMPNSFRSLLLLFSHYYAFCFF